MKSDYCRIPPCLRAGRWSLGLVAALLPVALALAQATGGTYTLRKYVVAGGVDAAGGAYTLVATVGQAEASPAQAGGVYRLTGGFHAPRAPRVDRILCDSFENSSCN